MIYFISGHRDVSHREFVNGYSNVIDLILETDKNPEFVVGDYVGVDTLAQSYLSSLVASGKLQKDSVTVYHMFAEPRNNTGDFQTFGGFINDEDRDGAMTAVSDVDIAWVRPGKKGSGTQQNIDRRANKGKPLLVFKFEGEVTSAYSTEIHARDEKEALEVLRTRIEGDGITRSDVLAFDYNLIK